jgi:hypothetical protein
MAALKPDAIADIEPLHGAAKIGFLCFDQEVIMVVHQHVRMDPDREALGGLR